MSSRVESVISVISSGFESAKATALSEKIPVKVFDVPRPCKICWEIFFLKEILMFFKTSAWYGIAGNFSSSSVISV